MEKEKHISKEILLEAIESALVSAYKKNYGTSQNVRVDINEETGDINVYMRMDVVADEDFEDDLTQITLEEAMEIDPRYEVGDVVEYQVTPRDFGRIAAQTAKQVVVQRIREAERGMILTTSSRCQGEIVTGTVQRVSNETLFINVGNTEGILSPNEQVPASITISMTDSKFTSWSKKKQQRSAGFPFQITSGSCKKTLRAGSSGN